jgi:GTPase
MSNFVDHIKVFCRSGKGGAGSVHFYRGKYIPKGGPDGGDGGRGGHIILVGNKQLWTLLHLRYKKHIFAEDGTNGSSNNKTGQEGKDIYIEVPLGTVAKDAETGEIECEITEDGQQFILLRGGQGGKGNTHFKSPTNQTPRYAQPGEPSIEATKILELKILADVGLVGFPNAGKSTFLSVISAAKPKIADYAFTTLTPNLGMVPYRDDASFVVADIPGIIEGAHEGKGLGLRFLRHIERNSVLLFMIPCDSEDIKEDYDVLLNELKLHNPELLDKQRLLAITKCDMIDEELKKEMNATIPDIDFCYISSITGEGIQELKDLIWKKINQL